MVDRLAALLGHDVTVAQIAASLAADRTIKVLSGPPGSGKTWTSRAVAGAWELAGGCALVATGNRLQAGTPLYPLKVALAALTPAWRTVGEDLSHVGSAGEGLLGTSGIMTAAVRSALKLRPSRVRARKRYLGDDEQRILFEVERLAKGRPILLVCDDLQWWDSQSVQLVGRFREPGMASAFPALFGLQVLGVETLAGYEPRLNPDALAALLHPLETSGFNLSRPARETFGFVLAEFGADADEAAHLGEAVYGLTGGHLALASQCANSGGSLERLIHGVGGEQELLQAVLVQRLLALGVAGERCIKLLQVAAVLGLTFGRDELACVAEEHASRIAQLLHECRAEDLIDLVQTRGTFTSALFHQYFLGLARPDSVRLSEIAGVCVRQLRPTEYGARCLHALNADDIQLAETLSALALIQIVRQGKSPDELALGVQECFKGSSLLTPVLSLVEAMHAADRGNYDHSLELLDGLTFLPTALAAEVDMLKAACLVESRDETGRREAIELLLGWDGYESQEPDLGLRLLNSRLYALSLDVDQEAARRVETQMQRILRTRDFDPSARDALHVLDRCSGRIYPPERSLPRVERAAAYFAPMDTSGSLRRPIEAYWALSNLVAKQVTNVRYVAASETADRLEELIESYEDGTFPRLDFARSNIILARYRSMRLSADSARLQQADVLHAMKQTDDPFYAGNALAVYELLCGRADESLSRFVQLQTDLQQRDRPVASLQYLIGSNFAAATFVGGHADEARTMWDSLEGIVELVPYSIRPFLRRRHELLALVLRRDEPISATEFDTCLLARDEIGPQWNQLGRGFRMPEVEWWR